MACMSDSSSIHAPLHVTGLMWMAMPHCRGVGSQYLQECTDEEILVLLSQFESLDRSGNSVVVLGVRGRSVGSVEVVDQTF